MISSAVSHPNKALIIYWGNEDDELRIPTRSSLSVTLEGISDPLCYYVTLRTDPKLEADRVFLDSVREEGAIYQDFVHHLDIMRRITGFVDKLEVITKKTFPIGSGLAGSAACYSALAHAFAGLVGDKLDKTAISGLARLGSGSACRSVYGGFVRWNKGHDDQSSTAQQIFDEKHWDIRDLIAIVDPNPKRVKSFDGMKMSKLTAERSLYNAFNNAADGFMRKITTAIENRDIDELGRTYEEDNILFRKLCLATEPNLDYWTRSTTRVIEKVNVLRKDGIPAYAGTDAGPNVHIFTSSRHAAAVSDAIREIQEVKELIHCKPGPGSTLTNDHLSVFYD